jgi:tetratricopeptide (TPR) repeat protein
LTEPLLETYRKVALIEPLAKQLKLKKARLQEVLQAYGAASETGAAEVVTAATFQTAALYQDFGRALMASQRPKKLNKAELEQYNVMLEEQAFPFEEQAIQLHESNARRAAGGVYDEHVRKSFAELAAMKPARWGKAERGDPALPMDAAKLEAALRETPGKVALLNQLGIAQRRDGRFEQARQSYEAAIAVDPLSSASHLNLAILFDLYLGDAAKALPLYQRGLELSPADAATVGKWVAELKSRKPPPNATATVASKEGA